MTFILSVFGLGFVLLIAFVVGAAEGAKTAGKIIQDKAKRNLSASELETFNRLVNKLNLKNK